MEGRRKVVRVHELKVTGLIPWTKWGKYAQSSVSLPQCPTARHFYSKRFSGSAPAAASRSVRWTCVGCEKIKPSKNQQKQKTKTKISVHLP